MRLAKQPAAVQAHECPPRRRDASHRQPELARPRREDHRLEVPQRLCRRPERPAGSRGESVVEGAWAGALSSVDESTPLRRCMTIVP